MQAGDEILLPPVRHLAQIPIEIHNSGQESSQRLIPVPLRIIFYVEPNWNQNYNVFIKKNRVGPPLRGNSKEKMLRSSEVVEKEKDLKTNVDKIIRDLAVKQDIFGILNRSFGEDDISSDRESNEPISYDSIPIQRIKIYASDIRRLRLFDLPIPNERILLKGTSSENFEQYDFQGQTFMSIRWMPTNMRKHIALRILILATVDINTNSIEREKKAISYKKVPRKLSLNSIQRWKWIIWRRLFWFRKYFYFRLCPLAMAALEQAAVQMVENARGRLNRLHRAAEPPNWSHPSQHQTSWPVKISETGGGGCCCGNHLESAGNYLESFGIIRIMWNHIK